MSTVDIALSLAAVGWYVFPCSAEGKPLVRWGEEATIDLATIKRWFRRDERVGIHCGRSGLLVVDRDRKDGRDGFASLKQAGITLPPTFHYKSRSGRGRHDVYAAPADVACTIATDVHGMAGVDVRAGVGMVIYNGPVLTEPPRLGPAPAWALVRRKERGYSSTVSLEQWLAEERSAYPFPKALALAEAIPLDGVTNAELLTLLTPLVDELMWGHGRREAYDIARERYTRNYPDAGDAFDRAWEKAIARVEADWQAVMRGTARERREPPKSEVRAGSRRLELTPASVIKPRPVRWQWEGRIAIGTLALLAGREGIGKSTLAYWLAAQITRGQLPGESVGQPRGVLIAATEDSWEHTIVPRLIAARADLDKVFRVAVRSANEVYAGMNLIKDLNLLEEAAVQVGAGLLLLDPLMSRLGDQDTHKDSEVRIALEPLVDVADRTGMAVLGLMHHNKSGSTDPLQLVMGSKAFTAVARSVHTVVADPDDESEERKLFGTPKNNLGRTDLSTLSFTIVSTPVETDEGTAWTGRLVWGAEVSESISAVMERSGAENTDRTALKEAADWLHDFLSINGVVGSARVKDEGRKAGHSESALKRARHRIKAETRSEGFPRTTFWFLPDEDGSPLVHTVGPGPGESV